MKLRWRQHERILITILMLLVLGMYWWKTYRFSLHQPDPSYIVPLSFYINKFLPKAGPVLLLYFCFLWINLRIVPGFQLQREPAPGGLSFAGRVIVFLRKHPWETIQVILLFFVLLLGFTIASRYNLRPAGFFSRPPGILRNFNIVAVLLVLYGAYITVRETAIEYIERPDSRQSYRIAVTNQVTTFFAVVTLTVFVLGLFEITNDRLVIFGFYALIMCSFATAMVNIYWLFPVYGKEAFFNYRLLWRVLLSAFVCSLPSLIRFSDHRAAYPLVFLWALEFFFVTPISWLLYQLGKDKILQLRGMEKELVQSKSDLAFLRSQINPHFLFNVLNTLYGTALQERADRTAEGIQKLGDMMRFMLHENNLEQIKMSREIEYLENYISLQKLRTVSSPAIVIEDDIRAQHCDHTIAPMLLIPFVENAFKHGISLQEASWIKITLRCDEQYIYFDIRNSVHARQGNDAEKNAPGIGLHNVRERLKWLYPGRYDLEVNSNQQEFLVRLVIHAK